MENQQEAPRPQDPSEEGESSQEEEQEEQKQASVENDPKFGCKHYKRRCSKKCPECNEFFPCRLCHDDVKYYNEMDPKKNHQFNRHAVKEIKCNNCETVQKPQENCEKCGIEFAGYFCNVCIFFDNDWEKKQIFHCEGCGICRVGGRNNFFHCDTCQCCLAISMKGSHPCVQGKLKQDCAVCMEDMHNSVKSSTFLRCGHAMHSACYNTYLKNNNIACPMCKKSVIDPKYIEAQIDLQIAQMPMPAEYKDTKMIVMCNDCLEKSKVPFHVLGGKCRKCKSYNTTRIDDDKFKPEAFQDEEEPVVEAPQQPPEVQQEPPQEGEADNEDDWEDQ